MGDELKMDHRNYRKHGEENKNLIRKSLSELGAGRSIVADADGELIAGNGVYEQAKRLGIPVKVVKTDGRELVVVQRTDLHTDDIKRRKLALADNATSDASEWNAELIRQDWDNEALLDWGLESLIKDEESCGETNPDQIPDVPDENISKFGEIYRLGQHRLLCGDATDKCQVERLVGGKQVDLWLTDPPYNVAYTGKTADALTIKNDNMDDSSFVSFLTDSFIAATGSLKPGGAFYIWHADLEGLNFRSACLACGLKVRQCLIWNKNCIVIGRQDYQCKHEPCLYGWKDGAGHYFCPRRDLPTVIDMQKPTRSEDHPTMKPVDLFVELIKNSTRRNEIVLDTFCGSGTTVIASEKTERCAYVMELDPKYCDVIRRRYAEFTAGEGCDWQKLTPAIENN